MIIKSEATLRMGESMVLNNGYGRRIARLCAAIVVWLTFAVSMMVPIPALSGFGGPTSRIDIAHHLAQQMRSGLVQEIVVDSRILFRGQDLNMDGKIDAGDIDIEHDSIRREALRYALLEVLHNDINFDGIVTREEVVAKASEDRRRRIYVHSDPETIRYMGLLLGRFGTGGAEQASRIMRYDRNGDGSVELLEVLASVGENTSPHDIFDSFKSVFAAMDGNGDSSITLAEFDKEAERVVRLSDTDGDGAISTSEVDAHRVRYGLGKSVPDAR